MNNIEKTEMIENAIINIAKVKALLLKMSDNTNFKDFMIEMICEATDYCDETLMTLPDLFIAETSVKTKSAPTHEDFSNMTLSDLLKFPSERNRDRDIYRSLRDFDD